MERASANMGDARVEPATSGPAAGGGAGAAAWLARREGAIRLAALLVVLGSFLAAAMALPADRALRLLQEWVAGAGAVAPLAYGAIYVLAAILFVPGTVLTVGAAVLFGLLLGVVVVSLASTTAAALAFLIGRHVARGKVAELAARWPKFGAVDRAIAEGGWRVVLLLRLTPVLPFSAGNYLFGLTGVRFLPYVLASWIGMLPATFVYVYLGYVGRESLAAAAGGGGRSTEEWVLLGVGLLAAVAVTVYVTRLATRAVRDRAGVPAEEPAPVPAAGAPAGSPGRALASLVVAAVAVVFAGCAHVYRDAIAGLFGPPQVEMREAYEPRPDGPSFDHSAYDALLREHVDAEGWVDYRGLAEDRAKLDRYLASVAEAPFDELGRDEKLTLLLNAYNAYTLVLILDHWPVGSIKEIDDPWDGPEFVVGGRSWTLNEIEHKEIRPKFEEPRIHFAVNCASIGCPPLRPEAYVAERLDEQLNDQTRLVHRRERWARFDRERGELHLSKIYLWYEGDFVQAADSVPAFAARYLPEVEAALARDETPAVKWLPYDWTLNDVEERPE